MAVNSADQCTYIVRTYQGLATFESRCRNRAKQNGLCGTHLKSTGKVAQKKTVRTPMAAPQAKVKRTTEVILKWDEGQGPVFPRSEYDAKSVSWLNLSVEVEGEVTADARIDGMGAFVKDNGEPSKNRTTMSYRMISGLPEEIRETVLAMFREAMSS